MLRRPPWKPGEVHQPHFFEAFEVLQTRDEGDARNDRAHEDDKGQNVVEASTRFGVVALAHVVDATEAECLKRRVIVVEPHRENQTADERDVAEEEESDEQRRNDGEAPRVEPKDVLVEVAPKENREDVRHGERQRKGRKDRDRSTKHLNLPVDDVKRPNGDRDGQPPTRRQNKKDEIVRRPDDVAALRRSAWVAFGRRRLWTAGLFPWRRPVWHRTSYGGPIR